MKKHRWLFTSSDLDTALRELKREGIKFLDFKRKQYGQSGYFFKIMCDETTAKKLGWAESK